VFLLGGILHLNRFIFILIAATSTLFSIHAEADVISASGGISFGRNSGFNDIKVPSPTFGAEYTFSVGRHLQLGGFFDHELIHFSDSTAGSINFVGLLVRYHFVDSDKSGPFVYGKAGLGSMSTNTMNPNQNLSFGSGLGYQIAINSVLSFSPRMGVSFLPDSPASGAAREARYDGGIMISFHF
jgi:hypothetical protein